MCHNSGMGLMSSHFEVKVARGAVFSIGTPLQVGRTIVQPVGAESDTCLSADFSVATTGGAKKTAQTYKLAIFTVFSCFQETATPLFLKVYCHIPYTISEYHQSGSGSVSSFTSLSLTNPHLHLHILSL